MPSCPDGMNEHIRHPDEGQDLVKMERIKSMSKDTETSSV